MKVCNTKKRSTPIERIILGKWLTKNGLDVNNGTVVPTKSGCIKIKQYAKGPLPIGSTMALKKHLEYKGYRKVNVHIERSQFSPNRKYMEIVCQRPQ